MVSVKDEFSLFLKWQYPIVNFSIGQTELLCGVETFKGTNVISGVDIFTQVKFPPLHPHGENQLMFTNNIYSPYTPLCQ